MNSVTARGSVPQATGLLIAGVGLICLVFAGSLFGWWTVGGEGVSDALTSWVPAVAFIALGALILWRSDAYRIGWLLGAMGLSVLAAGVAGGLADLGYLAGDAIGGAFWLSWIMAIGLLIAWFPTGAVVSPGWLWLQWAFGGAIGLTFFLYTFSEELCVDYFEGVAECVRWAANPLGMSGLPNPEFGAAAGPLFTIGNVLFLSAVVSLIVRMVRSKGVERQQLKWFLFAGGLAVVGFLLESAMEGFGVVPVPVWVDVVATVGLVTLPVSVILAILRYRLYEIDRIISRTISYAIVVGIIVGVVALIATAVSTQFESPMIVAATTLAIAAAFNPLRRRVQTVVDRRFNRSRYDAERVIDEFAGSLRDRTDALDVIAGWVGVVGDTMQPSRIGVWVR